LTARVPVGFCFGIVTDGEEPKEPLAATEAFGEGAADELQAARADPANREMTKSATTRRMCEDLRMDNESAASLLGPGHYRTSASRFLCHIRTM
jgi:hypothetical protein